MDDDEGLPAVAGVTHGWVQVGDVLVHYAEAGSGPAVVLIHGWPQHWYAFRHVMQALRATHQVFAVDLRGQGWTSVPGHGYDRATLAADLLGFLDAVGLDEVALVGHDWGGIVGFDACRQAPDRFRAFVPLSVIHPWQPADARVFGLWRFAYQPFLATPVVGPWLHAAVPAVIRAGSADPTMWHEDDLRVYADRFRGTGRAEAGSALYRNLIVRAPRELLGLLTRRLSNTERRAAARLRTPTRMVVGAADPVIGSRFLPGWERYADDMKVRVQEGCGHFLPEENVLSVVAALAEAEGAA